ncbi:MAG: beta-galactosidase, partial [Lentisphaerae bacterium]
MIYFGAAYYPEHRDPERWDYDLEQMEKANVNCLRVAEFAWSRLEPEDGRYDFEWLETFIRKAETHGIQILLCTPLRTLPAWLMAQDETLKLQREDGVCLEYGSRYSYCINHPLLQQKARALAEAMSKQWGNDANVAGWHLDNEHGSEPDCHCDLCREKFQRWCQQRYETLEHLNESWGLAFWGLQFNDWSQIPTPRVTKAFHSPG